MRRENAGGISKGIQVHMYGFFPASEYRPCGIEIESYPSAGTENADYTCEIWIAVEKNNN